MSDEIPDNLRQAQKAAQRLIESARKNISAMLCVPDGWQRFSRSAVQTLCLHAVTDPAPRALADFLCEMTPGEFLKAEFEMNGLTVEAASKGLACDLRMLKLRSAVIEAGLAEQLAAGGEIRKDARFSAQRLEKVLDEWLRSGRHRGAEFDDAPLSKIDETISRQCGQPEEALQIRLGLLIPVVSAIHIWRTLEQYPEDTARELGWVDF